MHLAKSFNSCCSLGKNTGREHSTNHQTKQQYHTDSEFHCMTHSVDTKSIVNVLHVVANRAAVGGNQKTVYFVGDEIAQVHDSLGTGE